MIQTFTQNENSDKEIFGLLGSWMTSKKVHDELGMAITSQDSDIWYIKTQNNEALGFALARFVKSTNAIHVRFLFGEYSIKKELLKEIIKIGKKDKIKSVWTNDRKTEKLWKEQRFIATFRARGEFCRWEKELVIKKGGTK